MQCYLIFEKLPLSYQILYMLKLSRFIKFPSFSSLSKLNSILWEISHGEVASHRIQKYLKLTKEQLTYSLKSGNFQKVSVPQNLNLTNVKLLREYIKNNKIPENIRILHALAHIEFCAFLAYVDTSFRFTNLLRQEQRQEFFEDIASISRDQGSHFLMLSKRLSTLGYGYGQLPVISNLINTVHETSEDLLARLAAISIVHEGRGIDSIDKLINKLHNIGDIQSVSILEQIKSEQTGHFLKGRKWFMKLCQNQSISLEDAITKLNANQRLRLKISDFKLQIS